MNDTPAPRSVFDLLGHQQAERTFLDAWSSGRMAHAWLLSGPMGIGKATLAYRMARFVLSGGGQGGGLFGDGPTDLFLSPDHPVSRRVAAGGHGDLKVIERGYTDDKRTKLRTEIVVDDVRGIGHFMSMTPAEGGWRVVIIDSADEMNRNAANAVLKTLEEPPRNALMILISHSPGRLLPTIRSRCRRLALSPLSNDHVEQIVRRSQSHLSAADCLGLITLAEGSAGKALALADQGGLDLYREIIGMLTALPKLDVPALHGFAERVARPEQDAAWRCLSELLTWWLARLVRCGGTAGQGVQEIVVGESALMGRLLTAASLERWLQVWENVSTLFSRTDAVNLDRKQAILTAILSIERLAKA